VRGLSSGALAINSRALDAETLLVFEDRKVLGHVDFLRSLPGPDS
jgi:hypothetical protein